MLRVQAVQSFVQGGGVGQWVRWHLVSEAKKRATARGRRLAGRQQEKRRGGTVMRSEERRVGEEGRSRGCPHHLKKKKRGHSRPATSHAIQPCLNVFISLAGTS